MLKLNLGCGPLPIHPQHYEIMTGEGWVLVDKYVKDDQIKNWDAEVLSEVDNRSVDAIYSSHLLEHISHTKLQDVLSQWGKKLRSGGELILNVPDLKWICRAVLRGDGSSYYDRFWGEHGIISCLYGSQSHEGEYHKSGFTEESISFLLSSSGFVVDSIRSYVDAHDMGVLLVKSHAI